MKEIRKLADKHNLKIIEDAAHSIEASREGIRVGNWLIPPATFLCHKILPREGGQ
jgi:dTDP-4-amino-4,6-dideoxygalactose transaminase